MDIQRSTDLEILALRVEDVEALIERADDPSVSIFMPTHRAGPPAQQDQIRLKNLLREAEDPLRQRGLTVAEAADLLAPARALLGQASFWRHQSDGGLALFVSPALALGYRVPVALEEGVAVDARFRIKPLLRLLGGDGRFYILALSQHGVRLLEATRDHVAAVPLDDVPGSVDEALNYDVPDRGEVKVHRSVSGTANTTEMRGHGEEQDAFKKDIAIYFRRVDDRVAAVLKQADLGNPSAPLVLAGVEYLLPIYRAGTTYRNVAPQGVTGNPEGLRDEELHARAWEIVRDDLERAESAIVDRYRELVGTGRTSKDLDEILTAAQHGRIDVLFVVDRAPSPSDEDRLDLAATWTLRNRGAVRMKASTAMPDDAPAAAIFRY